MSTSVVLTRAGQVRSRLKIGVWLLSRVCASATAGSLLRSCGASWLWSAYGI
ncbi:hypothetical protein JG688_00007168 [Phytophthora aleatoria]|uniref:Uncharacterized protein n=1 Tax=Phytophthora aleatoria TaxID=2496075 RepID=A0A8J5M8B2_9STRA|nr:hypothetical protein JG688_00007168 [Phytophthora aleatoria]